MLDEALPSTNTSAVFITVPERFRTQIETSLGHYLTLSISTDSFGRGSRQPTVLSGPVATIVIGTDIPGVTSIVASLPPPPLYSEEIRNFSVSF